MVVLVRGDTEIARWPLDPSPCSPALALVDRLARLQLLARRLGFSIRLLSASPQLVELLALIGLSDVLPTVPDLRQSDLRQVAREPEGRKQVGIHEVVVPDDPIP